MQDCKHTEACWKKATHHWSGLGYIQSSWQESNFSAKCLLITTALNGLFNRINTIYVYNSYGMKQKWQPVKTIMTKVQFTYFATRGQLFHVWKSGVCHVLKTAYCMQLIYPHNNIEKRFMKWFPDGDNSNIVENSKISDKLFPSALPTVILHNCTCEIHKRCGYFSAFLVRITYFLIPSQTCVKSAVSFPLQEENRQIFLSAWAVLLVAKAAWRTEFEPSPGQAEPITRALTTCPTPTARQKIPALGGKNLTVHWLWSL